MLEIVVPFEVMGAQRQIPVIRGDSTLAVKSASYQAWCDKSDQYLLLTLPRLLKDPANAWIFDASCIVSVGIVCVFQRPERRPKAVAAEAWKTGLRVHRPSTPDADNCWKAATDSFQRAIRRMGVPFNDCCLELGGSRRWYAAEREKPSFTLIFRKEA